MDHQGGIFFVWLGRPVSPPPRRLAVPGPARQINCFLSEKPLTLSLPSRLIMLLSLPEIVGGSAVLVAISAAGGWLFGRRRRRSIRPPLAPVPALPAAAAPAPQTSPAEEELSSFIYSVSHDVRAPLRSIDGFSRALVEDYGALLDATAHGYVDRIRANSQRINAYIEHLLALSRLGRAALRPQRLDVSEIVTGLCERLQRENPARIVAWSVQPGVYALADREMLTHCLGRLLDNAWKFTGERAAATVGFTASGNPVVYTVTDDGAGFDPAGAGRLFGAFQRLHPPDQFPGEGVGLAAARRVVHRHGGRIWAEATPGGGARFSFTLAAEQGGD